MQKVFFCEKQKDVWPIEDVKVTNWLSPMFLVGSEAILHAKSLDKGWLDHQNGGDSFWQRLQRVRICWGVKMIEMRRWCSAEKFVIKLWISLWSTSQQSWILSAHPHTAARHFSTESYQCSANSVHILLTHTPLLSARVDCTEIAANVQLNLDFSPPQLCLKLLLINAFM